MTDATRAVIRTLYFVDHLPIVVIARELRLTPRSVRRALVVRGGIRRPRPQPKESRP